MKVVGSVIKERDVKFAVVVVKPDVMQNEVVARRAVDVFSLLFKGIPVVLMAQNPEGKPRYFGPRNFVRFMMGLTLDQVRWQRYTFDDQALQERTVDQYISSLPS